MEFTEREKHILYVYGCRNYKLTMERLGCVCALMVDPLEKASACSLRNKLSEIHCEKWYVITYSLIREELGDLTGTGGVA
jgi:hypothetical protein